MNKWGHIRGVEEVFDALEVSRKGDVGKDEDEFGGGEIFAASEGTLDPPQFIILPAVIKSFKSLVGIDLNSSKKERIFERSTLEGSARWRRTWQTKLSSITYWGRSLRITGLIKE